MLVCSSMSCVCRYLSSVLRHSTVGERWISDGGPQVVLSRAPISTLLQTPLESLVLYQVQLVFHFAIFKMKTRESINPAISMQRADLLLRGSIKAPRLADQAEVDMLVRNLS